MASNELTVSETTKDAGLTAPAANILIVDDIRSNLKIAEYMMSPYKMRISTCSSGSDAIAMVAENTYDIVFMDHLMPGIDGVEAAKRIRAMEGDYFKKLPIIALTASSRSKEREMFIRSGINDLLFKPLESARLKEILLKWLPVKKLVLTKTDEAVRENGFVDALRAVPGLSVDKAFAALGGSSEVYEHVITTTARLLPENISKLNSLIENDLQLYSVEAHGIKGVLNTIGAFSLGKKAYRLERLSKDGDGGVCRELHSSFSDELKCLLEELTAITDKNSIPKPSGEKSWLLKRLDAVSDAIKIFDTALAMRSIADLRKFSYGDRVDKALDKISSAFERFDYAATGRLVEKLKGDINDYEC